MSGRSFAKDSGFQWSIYEASYKSNVSIWNPEWFDYVVVYVPRILHIVIVLLRIENIFSSYKNMQQSII